MHAAKLLSILINNEITLISAKFGTDLKLQAVKQSG